MKNLIIRDSYIKKIDTALKNVPIVILIGARQVGKTSILQMLEYKPYIFLNGQEPSTALLFDKQETIEEYLKINLNKKFEGYLIIDEFQYLNNISLILKLLSDKHKNLKIICSGSSSLDIHQKVSESLAGRVRLIRVYSLSFVEYLKFVDINLFKEYKKYNFQTKKEIINTKINIFFNDYLKYGGLPRIALEQNPGEKKELLNDIYETYLLKEIRSYVKNEDFVGFNKLLRLLSLQIGCLININALSNACNLSYLKTEEYIKLLEQMYICSLIEPFTSNKKKEITKMKKLYFLDIGLRNIIYRNFEDIEFRKDKGEVFENFIYLEFLKIKRNFDIINFYRTSDGTEVDFILQLDSKTYPVEVKFSNFDKPKSFKNLTSFMSNNKLKHSFVINKNFTYDLKTEKGIIKFRPGVLIGTKQSLMDLF